MQTQQRQFINQSSIGRAANTIFFILVLAIGILANGTASAAPLPTVDLEDAPLPRFGQNYYNGSDGAGGFTSQGAHFQNRFTDFGGFTAWEGWSYSAETDVVTPGFANQYSAYNLPGGGGSGSRKYAVASKFDFDPTTPDLELGRITLPSGFRPKTVDVTNTVYTALTLLQGDEFGFAKKFGGPSGTDPDWLRLTILGLDASAGVLGSVPFYLADYRNLGAAPDYVVNRWTTVDLGPLREARALAFLLESSDSGSFGMNTPAYFALDNLTPVPEPSSLALAAMGILALLARRGRRDAPRR